ncbi:MAG TPA: hypothetical protein VFZ99_06255 [Terriglobales bacterium]
MLKQYLILKVVKDFGSDAAKFVPLLGVMTQYAAEQFLHNARLQDPASSFVIQEVGAA